MTPSFLVPRPDGTYSLILNLKKEKKKKENVSYEHFNLENLQSATDTVNKGYYMASVDLTHAYS